MRVFEPPCHELLAKLTPYLVWFREYSLELIRNFAKEKWTSQRFPRDKVGKLLTLLTDSFSYRLKTFQTPQSSRTTFELFHQSLN
jgi:hypothetical protein